MKIFKNTTSLPLFYSLLKYSRKAWLYALWISFLQIIPGILLTSLLQYFMDEIMTNKGGYVLILVGYCLSCAISFMLEVLRQYMLALINSKTGYEFAFDNIWHCINFPSVYYKEHSPADVSFRIAKGTHLVNGTVYILGENLLRLVTGSFFLVFMFKLSSDITLICLSLILLNFLWVYFTQGKLQKITKDKHNEEIKLNSLTTTGVSLIESIKIYVMQDFYFTKWTNPLSGFITQCSKEKVVDAMVSIFPTVSSMLYKMIVICIGVLQVIDGKLTIGSLFAFLTLLEHFVKPINNISIALSKVKRLSVFGSLLKDIIEAPEDNRFSTDSLWEPSNGEIEFKNVTFGYDSSMEPLIENFNLFIPKGHKVALVGGSGSGKTTIGKLASGLLTPWSGSVMLDGKSIFDYSKPNFYKSFASVDQRIVTFKGSVRENLTLFSSDYDYGNLKKAIEDASLDEVLAQKSSYLDFQLNENGAGFSGGQLQRIEIARAFAKNTPFVIFDEATSALDPVTEEKIVKAIKDRGCSCLFVAHRLSTIRDCDEIIVLNRGKIVERGNHKELMALDGTYSNLMKVEVAQRKNHVG